jgi:hypothetical protein
MDFPEPCRNAYRSQQRTERHLKPAAVAVGVQIGGWHDFRHTLSSTLRPAGVHPVVIKDPLHHSRVDLAEHLRQIESRGHPCRSSDRAQEVAGRDLLPKDLLPATPNQADGGESGAELLHEGPQKPAPWVPGRSDLALVI